MFKPLQQTITNPTQQGRMLFPNETSKGGVIPPQYAKIPEAKEAGVVNQQPDPSHKPPSVCIIVAQLSVERRTERKREGRKDYCMQCFCKLLITY